jgi:hypothetical protein
VARKVKKMRPQARLGSTSLIWKMRPGYGRGALRALDLSRARKGPRPWEVSAARRCGKAIVRDAYLAPNPKVCKGPGRVCCQAPTRWRGARRAQKARPPPRLRPTRGRT